MTMPNTLETERVLILAPVGRDAAIAEQVLAEAGRGALPCADLGCLLRELETGVGVALISGVR